MSTLAELQAELARFQDDLKICHDMLAIDPNDEGALETIPLLEEQIADVKAQIATKQDAAPPPPPADGATSSKFSKSSNDAPPPPPDEAHQTVFNVKDSVMAKYSEDKQWYQATIVTKTGSSTDPVYKVTFKGYGNTETKRKHEIRAMPEPSKKRKADGSPAINTPTQNPSSPKPAQNGAVISALPSVDKTLVQKKEPSKVSDGPTRLAPEPKKLKGNKVLDKSKANWQTFQKEGMKKGGFGGSKLGKESQFRTPDLPNARVGFTGSGKPMQKDQVRKTWQYGGGGGGNED
jgi:survival of motor neuron-related-splicing factor 30